MTIIRLIGEWATTPVGEMGFGKALIAVGATIGLVVGLVAFCLWAGRRLTR